MNPADLSYIWDGSRLFVRYHPALRRPAPRDAPFWAGPYAVFSVPDAGGPDRHLIGTFELSEDTPATFGFGLPESVFAVPDGGVVAPNAAARLVISANQDGHPAELLSVVLDSAIDATERRLSVLPFGAAAPARRAVEHVIHLRPGESPQRAVEADPDTGTDAAIARMHWRRRDRADARGRPEVVLGRCGISLVDATVTTRVSARVIQVPQKWTGGGPVPMIEHEILNESIDRLACTVCVDARRAGDIDAGLRHVLGRVYFVHLTVQKSAADERRANPDAAGLPPPLPLPGEILERWSASRLPEANLCEVASLVDAVVASEGAGIRASVRPGQDPAVDRTRRVLEVEFPRAATCDVVGILVAGGAQLSVAEDAAAATPVDLRGASDFAFFRVADGGLVTGAALATLDSALMDARREVEMRFRADEGTLGPPAVAPRSGFDAWKEALAGEVLAGAAASGAILSAQHPVEAEALADALRDDPVPLAGWAERQITTVLRRIPQLLGLAVRNRALADILSRKPLPHSPSASLCEALLVLHDAADFPADQYDATAQLMTLRIVLDPELFDTLRLARVGPPSGAEVPADAADRLRALLDPDVPIAEYVEYAEDPDAPADLRADAPRFRRNHEIYAATRQKGGWAAFELAMTLADQIRRAKHGFATEAAPQPEPQDRRRAPVTELRSRGEYVAAIRRLLDESPDMTLDGPDLQQIRVDIEKASTSMLRLRGWHRKLVGAAGSSGLDRAAEAIIRELGMWAGLPDIVSRLVGPAIGPQARREALSGLIGRAAVFPPARIDAARAGTDPLEAARQALHEEIRDRLTAATTPEAGPEGEDNRIQRERELCRLADMFLLHRTYVAIDAFLRRIETLPGSGHPEIARVTRSLLLWPVRPGATLNQARAAERLMNGTAGDHLAHVLVLPQFSPGGARERSGTEAASRAAYRLS